MSHQVKTMTILVARPGKVAEMEVLPDGLIIQKREELGNPCKGLSRDQADPGRQTPRCQ
jgi:hypothetical protein